MKAASIQSEAKLIIRVLLALVTCYKEQLNNHSRQTTPTAKRARLVKETPPAPFVPASTPIEKILEKLNASAPSEEQKSLPQITPAINRLVMFEYLERDSAGAKVTPAGLKFGEEFQKKALAPPELAVAA